MDGWETKTTGGEEVHACTARTDAPNQKPKLAGSGQLLVLVLHRQCRPTPAEGPGQTRTTQNLKSDTVPVISNVYDPLHKVLNVDKKN